MPRFGCSMTVFNVRPNDAPIFRACQEWDLSRVKYLLESGQASVYDVEDEIGGLLEHVVQGDYKRFWYMGSESEHSRIQRVLEYLLDQGCDPSVFYGAITARRLPAVLFAFDRGYSSAVSSMLSHGADIVSYGSILAGFFRNLNAGLGWKVKLVQTMGYSDWKPESLLGPVLSNNILHGACGEANLQEVLFGLEIAGLDPNMEGSFKHTALGNAAERNFLKGAAVLIECGAEVDSSEDSGNGTLLRSIWGTCNDVTHYLLLHGANPRLKSTNGISAWSRILYTACGLFGNRLPAWSFVRLEGELAHLLLHELDPFEFLVDLHSLDHNGYFYPADNPSLQLRAPEIARSWSYNLPWNKKRIFNKDWMSSFEDAEESRGSYPTFSWSPSGMIYQMSSKENEQYLQDTEDTFFREQTQFYHHFSSPKDRKRLSRFPMALALCDALQFAGYRAEMDDDGDIWYEIEDGDRYFDAREYILEDDHGKLMTELCPICQDLQGHGLGHILQDVEEARHELLEYREKVKTQTNHFF